MGALNSDSWSALYQAQLANYQTAMDIDHNSDAKGGVVVAAILAVVVFALDKSLFETQNKLIFSLVILGSLFYAIAVISQIIGMLPKNYPLPAVSTKDHPEYLELQDNELMYKLIVDVETFTSTVNINLKKKAFLLTLSTSFFLIGTLLLLVAKLTV